jgi:hypothetical protein
MVITQRRLGMPIGILLRIFPMPMALTCTVINDFANRTPIDPSQASYNKPTRGRGL